MTSTLSSRTQPSRTQPPRTLRPDRSARHTAAHLPTRLRPADLLRITDQGVADVLDGRYDHLLPTAWDPVERWSTRLESDDDLDLWLISWTPDRSTDLHDHAGSLGALTVLSGALREYRWTGDDLALRILSAGDQAAFPLGWVHDVQHHGSIPPTRGLTAPTGDTPVATPSGPTLSVHAYSPPLTAMSFYEVTDGGALRRTRTELTDEPE
ncbi:cysteine dioxygenase [Gordonia polyisoprenivorans]|uniref:cysteine dioxygenase n=1 Tax=Gordonia polyisoprenivorans TaxID=84595 RepID=UPI001B8C3827|nr:cysteine dioxygenase [Gordonia polyisoprenivorans]QUD84372.1 cysteine dioxygenase [Gordonia polyisoprenivorans]